MCWDKLSQAFFFNRNHVLEANFVGRNVVFSLSRDAFQWLIF